MKLSVSQKTALIASALVLSTSAGFAAGAAFLGFYMLIINLAVYGNLIPLWVILISLASLVFLPLTKVEDGNGKQFLAFWGVAVNQVKGGMRTEMLV